MEVRVIFAMELAWSLDQVNSRGPKAWQKRCILKWYMKDEREMALHMCWGGKGKMHRQMDPCQKRLLGVTIIITILQMAGLRLRDSDLHKA